MILRKFSITKVIISGVMAATAHLFLFPDVNGTAGIILTTAIMLVAFCAIDGINLLLRRNKNSK